MKRLDFFKSILGVGIVASNDAKAEPIAKIDPTNCDCGSKLIDGKCIHKKRCNFCMEYRHFIEDHCEICHNGHIPVGAFSFAICSTDIPNYYSGYKQPKYLVGSKLKKALRKL